MKQKADYKLLIERVSKTLAKTPKELARFVEITEEYMKAASDMTKDELALIEAYFKRDLQSFSEHYQYAKKEDVQNEAFRDVIENSIWDKLAEITDKTQLEWHEVLRDIEHHGVYQAGEVVGLGILICEQCGHETSHSHVGIIENCVKCGCEKFTRQAYPA